jgi:hypothetical protein
MNIEDVKTRVKTLFGSYGVKGVETEPDLQPQTDPVNDSEPGKPFLLIDNTMTMHGVRFQMTGGRWDRFKKNPVMLYMHTRGRVVGKWIDLRFESGAWMAKPVFDLKDSLGVEIARQVGDGFLNACSIGVQIHKAETIENEVVITDWEPYECSIVDAGSNSNALQLYTNKGEKIIDSEQYIKTLTLSVKGLPNQQPIYPMLNKQIPRNLLMAMGIIDQDADNKSIVTAIEQLIVKNMTLELSSKPGATQAITHISIIPDPEKDKEEYQKLFLSGGLEALKTSSPEKFIRLFKAEYGVEPANEVVEKKATPVKLPDSYGALKEDRQEFEELFKSGGLAALKAQNPEKYGRLFKSFYGADAS